MAYEWPLSVRYGNYGGAKTIINLPLFRYMGLRLKYNGSFFYYYSAPI